MAMNDALDIRQTDAGALKLARAVEPLEHSEKLIHVLHVEAGAVIANEDHDLLFIGVAGGAADFDPGFFARADVFHSVGYQIHQHLPQHGRIAAHSAQHADYPGEAPPQSVVCHIAQDTLDDLIEINSSHPRFDSSHPCHAM